MVLGSAIQLSSITRCQHDALRVYIRVLKDGRILNTKGTYAIAPTVQHRVHDITVTSEIDSVVDQNLITVSA